MQTYQSGEIIESFLKNRIAEEIKNEMQYLVPDTSSNIIPLH